MAVDRDSILMLASLLKEGDQITIWKGKYQIHYKGVGTSNFLINNKIKKEKEKA
jgi:hypothetical protein|tara:strand:+ start:1007 stop:1168 length:162 start_codon:yes stop_codon:yes gene_type:complete